MIDEILPHVRRPSQYIGGEVGSPRKDPSQVSLRAALVFPDLYEIGMSHLGLHVLSEILNARPNIQAERVFAPGLDMKEIMTERGVPLSTRDSRTPVRECDLVGFTLPSELTYTTVLALLRLSGLPLRSEERRTALPLVIGGGTCAFNPEPLAPFFDAFFLGDAEEAILEIAEAVLAAKREGRSKGDLLRALAAIPGVYCPSLGSRTTVRRRIIPDIDCIPLPRQPVVPFTRLVHDRWNVEIARGCTLGCRFCQAGIIYRPVRERDPETVLAGAGAALEASGWEDLTLLSLSAGDYSCIVPLVKTMMDRWASERVSLSLPSLRAGSIQPEFLRDLKRVRKTGFTIAPETGSRRLRGVINKPISDEAIVEAAQAAFREGWRTVKLYFMIGLPTETDEDVEAIVTLASRIRRAGKAITAHPTVTVSVGTFVPKPHTPFQWEAMIPQGEAARKIRYLQERTARERLAVKWHDSRLSYLEALLARGGRALAPALEAAVEGGCYLDTWSEHVRHEAWDRALSALPGDVRSAPFRPLAREDPLPWDHLETGVSKDFLWEEREKSRTGEATPDCFRGPCTRCGLCDFTTIRPRSAAPGRWGRTKADAGPSPAVPAGPAPEAPPRPPWITRFRVRYCKKGEMRFLSHLELLTCLSRAFRRAGVTLRYSQGFHPLPRISFGPALPVGIESEAEYLDVEVEGAVTAEELRERVNARLPEGIRALDVRSVPLRAPGIVESLAESQYLIDIAPFSDRQVETPPPPCEVEILGGSLLRVTLRKGETRSPRLRDVVNSMLRLSDEEAVALRVTKVSSAFVPG